MDPPASIATTRSTAAADDDDAATLMIMTEEEEEEVQHEQPKQKILLHTSMRKSISTTMSICLLVMMIYGISNNHNDHRASSHTTSLPSSSSSSSTATSPTATMTEEEHNKKVEYLLRTVSTAEDDEHEQFEIDFLDEYGASTIKHSHLTLLHHLKGTHDLLKEWDQPLHLQDAGLFHSIYGTDKFRKNTVPVSERPNVEDVVGTDAEMLAWAFCAMSRQSFDEQISLMIQEEKEHITVGCGDFQQKSDDETTTTCEPLHLNSQQMKELAILHVANTMEQAPRFVKSSHPKPDSKWMKRINSHLETYGSILPDDAIELINEFNRNHQPLKEEEEEEEDHHHHKHHVHHHDEKLRTRKRN